MNSLTNLCEHDNLVLFKNTDYKNNLQLCLDRASAFGSLDILNYLLDNYKSSLNLNNGLFWASKAGNYKSVVLLLEHGAKEEENKSSIMESAIELGFTNVIESLIKYGYNVNQFDLGRAAVVYNRPQSLELLCDYGFDLRQYSVELIKISKECNNDEIVQLILKLLK